MSDIDSILEIDRLRLDDEWVMQPKLFHKYASELAEAKSDLEEAKAEFDIVCADLSKLMRDNPEHYDISKLTEKALEQLLPLQPRHKKALTEVNKAKHRVGILQAAVEALDHKKKALENLVWLHGQDYFAEPRVRGESRERLEEVVKRDVRSRGRKNAFDD